MSKWYASRQMTHCLAVCCYICCSLLLQYSEACLIRATLYVASLELRQEQDFGLPLDIECSNASSSRVASPFDLGAQRVAGKLHVQLNGSQTSPVNSSTYGLEYLDNCQQLQSLEIESFVGDQSLQLGCDGQQMLQLSSVFFRHNELATLSGNSFELLPQLQQLLLESNSLRLVESLKDCLHLKILRIRSERQLALRQSDLLLQLKEVQQIELLQLKLIAAELLQQLPAELKELTVRDTPIEPHKLRINQDSAQLINLTLVKCELTSFELNFASKLLQLNLSDNALRHLKLNSSALLSLDLSCNHLQSLNSSWFKDLHNLQTLQLQQNHLHSLSLLQLLQLSPLTLQQLNLSWNELIKLEQTSQASWNPLRQLRIQIDGNPWSCQWLLNFSHAQPELFRLFNYAKYISQINVNGLSCQPQVEQEQQLPLEQQQELLTNRSKELIQSHAHLNVSSHTVLFGNPVQQSHSQRSEAVIIVIMLPLGIALLFLLLYLYLHCERLFHWSYYSSGLGCFGANKTGSGQRFVDHIDIVRYPVANGNMSVDLDPLPDGYETPLSGSASICNCTGHRQSTCSRTHHVTYETMPTELPYQLYAEIKEQLDPAETNQMLEETPCSTAPIYDHLSYEEEKPLEV